MPSVRSQTSNLLWNAIMCSFKHSPWLYQGSQHFEVTKNKIWNIYIIQIMGDIHNHYQLPLCEFTNMQPFMECNHVFLSNILHGFIIQGSQHFQVTKSKIWNICIIQIMGESIATTNSFYKKKFWLKIKWKYSRKRISFEGRCKYFTLYMYSRNAFCMMLY